MGDRRVGIPQDQFVAAWNGPGSLDDVVVRVKGLAGGNVPRWAVLARAAALRKAGVVPEGSARQGRRLTAPPGGPPSAAW